MSVWPDTLARAYAACEKFARLHYENFPVASRLLPAPMRPHVAAVYAFARIADDLADEGEQPADARRAALDAWQSKLHHATHEQMHLEPNACREDLIVAAVAHSIRVVELPLSLFDDLLSAFGQDTMGVRYSSWDEVLDYCRRSANPVGRLVLRIAGYRDDRLDRSSDALCTALQLTNFWQDFGRDWSRGRLYVPHDLMQSCGAAENDLRRGAVSPAWAAVIAGCVAFTRDHFERGRMVCDAVRGRLRVELRFTWLGGERILERVDRRRSELLGHRPTLGAGDLPVLLWRAATWPASIR